jgi:uncharacterized metal-binding protein YceD (DUF177 family)
MTDVEFSRPVLVDRIGHEPKTFAIEASPEEREALARRFAILGIDAFGAELRLERGGTLVRLRGRFCADVVQSCVVTLDPVCSRVEGEIDMAYGEDEDAGCGEVVFGLDDPDPPDPIRDGVIDIGEATAEHLALALDPFPRAPGVQFELGDDDATEPPPRPSPFSVLASLKKK